jgi:hypothetical protein
MTPTCQAPENARPRAVPSDGHDRLAVARFNGFPPRRFTARSPEEAIRLIAFPLPPDASRLARPKGRDRRGSLQLELPHVRFPHQR